MQETKEEQEEMRTFIHNLSPFHTGNSQLYTLTDLISMWPEAESSCCVHVHVFRKKMLALLRVMMLTVAMATNPDLHIGTPQITSFSPR